jgi:predicted amidohydrolase YtcJ
MRADLVHLDTDLRTVSPEQLRDVRVVRTWLGGRPTHTTPSDHRVPLTKGTRA